MHTNHNNKALSGEAALQAAFPCKKLMILGGSNCQLHALQRAKERGLVTILADYTDTPPGAEYADVHLKISTFDSRACIQAAHLEQADGVLCVGTDQPVYTAAKIAHELHLPSALTVEEAFSVTNKRRMKELYLAAHIPAPASLLLTADGQFLTMDGKTCECTLTPPYVIKPLDAQGQRGVFKVSSVTELLTLLPEVLSYSAEEVCLVEEHYESDEITVSGWIKNGILHPFSIVDRIHYPDEVHIGVCTGHRYPSIHIDDADEILALSRQVISAFGLTEGPFYFQLMHGADGLKAGEVACRIGGAFEDVTIERLFHFPILDHAIDASLGADTVPDDLPIVYTPPKERAFVLLLFCRPGRIASVTPHETLLSLPFVADCGYNYRVGDEIPLMQNATARFGHAVLFGDEDTIASHVRTFFETLIVADEAGDNLLLTELIDSRYL